MTATLPPWAHVTAPRVAHVHRVTALLEEWAQALGVDAGERERWLRAAILHDALKDATPTLLRDIAPDAWDNDALRHGPAAAVMAARHGETDRGVLDAVRYHSVGFAGWDDTGRLLYLADYLEPGRPDEGHRRRWAREVTGDVAGSVQRVARARIQRSVAQGLPLLAETVTFWNALVCAAPPSSRHSRS